MFDSTSHIRQGNYTLVTKMSLGHLFPKWPNRQAAFAGDRSKTRSKIALD